MWCQEAQHGGLEVACLIMWAPSICGCVLHLLRPPIKVSMLLQFSILDVFGRSRLLVLYLQHSYGFLSLMQQSSSCLGFVAAIVAQGPGKIL